MIGLPDPRLGEAVTALVSLWRPATPMELINHVKTRLSAYKAPRHLAVVPAIPRIPNGKGDYAAATRMARTHRLTHAPPPGSGERRGEKQ